MAKKRLSKDQKRKSKLNERAKRPQQSPTASYAYYGSRYQREELVGYFHAAETGIHEADVAAMKHMQDDDVARALIWLIEHLRTSPLPESPAVDGLQGSVDALLVANIISRWHQAFSRYGRPTRDEQVGILRTTLASLATRGEMGGSSRGYLDYLTGFLKSVPRL